MSIHSGACASHWYLHGANRRHTWRAHIEEATFRHPGALGRCADRCSCGNARAHRRGGRSGDCPDGLSCGARTGIRCCSSGGRGRCGCAPGASKYGGDFSQQRSVGGRSNLEARRPAAPTRDVSVRSTALWGVLEFKILGFERPPSILRRADRPGPHWCLPEDGFLHTGEYSTL
jgi:hypothetical protein